MELPDFSVHGSTWVKFKGQDMKPEPGVCKACGENCGHNFWCSDPAAQKQSERYVRYTISTDRRVVAQDIVDAGHAQLMGYAPRLASMLMSIAESDPINWDSGWHDMGTPYCFYCDVTEDTFPPGSEPRYPHKADCLWRRCVELLVELDKEPRVWGVHDMTIQGGDEE